MSDDATDLLDQFEEEHTQPIAPTFAPQAVKVYLDALNDLNALAVLPSGLWQQIGPAPLRVDARQDVFGTGPIAGAVADILIHPDDPNTIFVAAGHGGVWRSTDGGTTFTPTMDGMPSLSICALGIDAVNHDVIYAGCGDLLRDLFSENVGLYKSIDRGLSWAVADGGLNATMFRGRGITRIVSNAADSLLVGTTDGLFRSVDGGLNFGANAPDFNDGKQIFLGIISSLALDKASPATRILFCVSGSSPAPTGGVYCLEIDSNNPAESLFSNPGAPALPFGDLVLAQSTQPNTDTLYVSVQRDVPATAAVPAHSTYVGLFRSTDAGRHWTPRPAAATAEQSDTPPDQTNYDLVVGVDPGNANVVYVGFQELFRSTNGGGTFGAAVSHGLIHFDQHALVFGTPAQPFTPMFAGEDGGCASSNNGGGNWQNLNASFATNFITAVDIGLGFLNHPVTFAGMQDTGIGGHRATDPGTEWHVGVDGDGRRVFVDPANPQIAYGFENQFFARTVNGGNAWANSNGAARTVGMGLPNREPAVRRIGVNPNGANPAQRVIYVSQGHDLFRSTDGGVHFAAVVVPFAVDISAMAFAVGDPNRMWVGLGDGTIHFTADNLVTWDAAGFPTAPGGPPAGFVQGIAVDPADPAHDRVAVCYVGTVGHNAKTRTQHVFLRDNAAAPWKDISGTDNAVPFANIPDMPCFAIVFDTKTTPSTINVAVANAVLTSQDLGNTWKILGVGLPNVTCTSLAIDNVDTAVDPRVLRVGTYGRSCFEFTKPAAGKLFVSGNLAFPPSAVGQTRSLTLQMFNPGATALNITSITGTTADFQLITPVPISIPANSQKPCEFHFTPTTTGNLTTTITITTDEPSTTTIPASGQSTPTTNTSSRLAVLGNLNFGELDTSKTSTLTFNVFNMGTKNLNILSINRKDGSTDFELLSPPAFPLLLGPTIDQEFTVQFKPSSKGPLTATFEVTSDASRATALIDATGTGTSSMSKVLIVIIVIVGVAVVVGIGVGVYEATKGKG
jgi:hypothetical protein